MKKWIIHSLKTKWNKLHTVLKLYSTNVKKKKKTFLFYKFFFSEVPVQEQFAMCFNTILSELASNYPDVRDIIVSAQIELFMVTSDIIVDICDQVQPQFQVKCM